MVLYFILYSVSTYCKQYHVCNNYLSMVLSIHKAVSLCVKLSTAVRVILGLDIKHAYSLKLSKFSFVWSLRNLV